MKIGILRETKIPPDNRVPLTPEQCRQIEADYPGIKIIVQSSKNRCFNDKAYTKKGIAVKEDLGECDILLGVKEVKPQLLMPDKTYLIFSHTIKKQSYNKTLLKTILERQIRLIDYEIMTDKNGMRIIGFGRWAGLVGAYLGISGLCIRHHLPPLLPPQKCRGLEDMMKQASECQLPPAKIALTGDGRVAKGSEEILASFGIQKINPGEYTDMVYTGKPVYVQLGPDQYNRHKSGKPFDLQYFFNHPDQYESDFGRFINKTDLLIMAAYWDPMAPVLFTSAQMKNSGFSIDVIADITCDLNGSVPSTIRTSTFKDPFYDYNPETGKEETAFSDDNHITVMAIDNLPCGLPFEASVDFGNTLLKYVIPLLIRGDQDGILEKATIAKNGKLTEKYLNLEKWVNE
ncbi:MAG: hypothetical protein JXR41_12560 [Bacteroidales bacterium]|nr:hypothetical protein [Bacteroidales bacterium]MBN2763918.1 hypothetical protein [Bacteroidales bacterium]